MIINASIDLTKIDKSKIKNHDNGSKYYPVTIFVNDKKDDYGNDVGICTSQTKEEREAGNKRTYIGNGRKVGSDASKATTQETTSSSDDSDGLPF